MSVAPSNLDAALRRVHGRVTGAAAAGRALRWLAALLLALPAVVAVDAALGLPPAGLVALDLALGAALLAACADGLRSRRGRRYEAHAAAMLAQERLGLPPGRLINAVDFSEQAPPGASPDLVQFAIRRGEDLAPALDPRRVVDKQVVRRPARWAAGATFACAATVLLLPGVYRAVVPRLLAPFADLPPFTRLTFDVQIAPETIHVGQDAQLRVRVAGPNLPPHAAVVFENPDGTRPRAPLWRETVATSPGAPPPAEAHFALRLERLEATRAFHIATPGGRSARQILTVRREPLLEHVALRFAFPAYTRWPPATERLGRGGIRALRGTRVALRCRANVPLAGGTLTLRPAQAAPDAPTALELALGPDAADPHSVTGAFTLAWSGAFVLELRGVDGARSDEGLQGEVVCADDRPPAVSIVAPDAVSLAPEGWKPVIYVEASDDVGLAALDLRVRHNAGPFESRPLARWEDAPVTATEAEAELDLEVLGAAAGSVLRYFAIARDNEPPDGKTADTAVQTLHIVTLEEYRNIARAAYSMEDILDEWGRIQAELEDLAEQRADALERLAALQALREEKGALSPADRAQAQALEQRLRQYAERTRTLAERLRERTETLDLYDVEKPYKDMLRELAAALEAQAEDADGVGQALRGVPATPGEAPPGLAAAAERFRANTRPFDRVAERERMEQELRDLDKAAELAFAAQRLQETIERQRDLADRMAAALASPTDAPDSRERQERLGAEQVKLERDLRDAVDGLARAAEAHREVFPRMCASADRLVAAATKLEAWDDQAAAAAAAVTDPVAAAGHAETAAKKLETLLSECNGMGGESASGDLDGCLSLCRPQGMATLQQLVQGMLQRLSMGAGMKAGGMGMGMGGAMATVGMVGPQLPGKAASQSQRSRDGRQERVGGGKRNDPDAARTGEAAVIRAESTLDHAADARQLPGVPAAYRDLAEAYFRRLARDGAGPDAPRRATR